MDDFYDDLSSLYHLIYQDWEASMNRQGEQLAGLFQRRWPGARKVLDVSCGIGTQALPLASRGYDLTGSDLSKGAIKRAAGEAKTRGLDIAFSQCDMRQVYTHHGTGFDIVLSADNSLPHLLTDGELLSALSQMYQCLVPGGGCIITVRDYEGEERGINKLKPYGVRTENGKRYLIFQVWDFEEEIYNLTFFFVEEDLSSHKVVTHTMRTRYYAVSTKTLSRLMEQAGFKNVERIDGAFYQPVLLGSR